MYLFEIKYFQKRLIVYIYIFFLFFLLRNLNKKQIFGNNVINFNSL